MNTTIPFAPAGFEDQDGIYTDWVDSCARFVNVLPTASVERKVLDNLWATSEACQQVYTTELLAQEFVDLPVEQALATSMEVVTSRAATIGASTRKQRHAKTKESSCHLQCLDTEPTEENRPDYSDEDLLWVPLTDLLNPSGEYRDTVDFYARLFHGFTPSTKLDVAREIVDSFAWVAESCRSRMASDAEYDILRGWTRVKRIGAARELARALDLSSRKATHPGFQQPGQVVLQQPHQPQELQERTSAQNPRVDWYACTKCRTPLWQKREHGMGACVYFANCPICIYKESQKPAITKEQVIKLLRSLARELSLASARSSSARAALAEARTISELAEEGDLTEVGLSIPYLQVTLQEAVKEIVQAPRFVTDGAISLLDRLDALKADLVQLLSRIKSHEPEGEVLLDAFVHLLEMFYETARSLDLQMPTRDCKALLLESLHTVRAIWALLKPHAGNNQRATAGLRHIEKLLSQVPGVGCAELPSASILSKLQRAGQQSTFLETLSLVPDAWSSDRATNVALVKAILQGLSRWSGTNLVRVQCFETLSRMARASSDTRVATISVLADFMVTSAANETVLDCGCRVFQGILRDHGVDSASLAQVVRAVVTVLGSRRDCPVVQMQCYEMLCSMASSDSTEQRRVMLDSNGCPSITNFMRMQPRDGDIQKKGCRALLKLVDLQTSAATIEKAGGVSAVVNAMKHHMNQRGIVFRTVSFLAAITFLSEESVASAMRLGSIPVIGKALKVHGDMSKIVVPCFTTLRNLLDSKGGTQEMLLGTDSAVQLVLSCIDTHHEKDTVVEAGLGVLNAVGNNPAMRANLTMDSRQFQRVVWNAVGEHSHLPGLVSMGLQVAVAATSFSKKEGRDFNIQYLEAVMEIHVFDREIQQHCCWIWKEIAASNTWQHSATAQGIAHKILVAMSNFQSDADIQANGSSVLQTFLDNGHDIERSIVGLINVSPSSASVGLSGVEVVLQGMQHLRDNPNGCLPYMTLLLKFVERGWMQNVSNNGLSIIVQTVNQHVDKLATRKGCELLAALAESNASKMASLGAIQTVVSILKMFSADQDVQWFGLLCLKRTMDRDRRVVDTIIERGALRALCLALRRFRSFERLHILALQLLADVPQSCYQSVQVEADDCVSTACSSLQRFADNVQVQTAGTLFLWRMAPTERLGVLKNESCFQVVLRKMKQEERDEGAQVVGMTMLAGIVDPSASWWQAPLTNQTLEVIKPTMSAFPANGKIQRLGCNCLAAFSMASNPPDALLQCVGHVLAAMETFRDDAKLQSFACDFIASSSGSPGWKRLEEDRQCLTLILLALGAHRHVQDVQCSGFVALRHLMTNRDLPDVTLDASKIFVLTVEDHADNILVIVDAMDAMAEIAKSRDNLAVLNQRNIHSVVQSIAPSNTKVRDSKERLLEELSFPLTIRARDQRSVVSSLADQSRTLSYRQHQNHHRTQRSRGGWKPDDDFSRFQPTVSTADESSYTSDLDRASAASSSSSAAAAAAAAARSKVGFQQDQTPQQQSNPPVRNNWFRFKRK